MTIINKGEKDYVGEIVNGITGRVPSKGVAAIVKDASGVRVLDFTYQLFDSDFNDLKPLRIKQLAGQEESMTVTFRNRECGLYDGAPFVDAWKPLPPNFHQIFEITKKVRIRKGTLALSEVTNQQFHEFVLASGYRPKQATRYLHHWQHGAPRTEELDLPVTFVDLDDAAAYANWAGSSIPTEWEWQYHFRDGKNLPPKVRNLTDSVHTDGRTRFLILKGGSSFNIRNGEGQKSTSGIAESDWYVDGGAKDSTWVEKLLLMGKGMSRSENIGFRCFTPEENK
jgi:hypothetical protein